MTYQELINQIRDLGFSDDSEMEDFGELVNNDINRSITEINLEVAPIIERYEFDITNEDEGYLYITMPDIDDNFLDFADTPILYAMVVGDEETPLYRRFNDYEIEAGDTIVINADELKIGDDETLSIRVFYKVEHTPYTEETLNTEIPLPRKVHHLIPLLARYVADNSIAS